jgi:hypothetical protein
MSSITQPSTFRIFPPSPPHQADTSLTGLTTRSVLPGESKEEDLWRRQATLLLGGLRTPPEDLNMGTTYQAPSMAYENGHVHHSAYASTLVPSTGSSSSYTAYSHTEVPSSNTQSVSSRSRHTATSAASNYNTIHYSTSRPSTQPTTPESTGSRHELRVSTSDISLTTHSMMIPSCISPRGGSLSDFAAQVSLTLKSLLDCRTLTHFSDGVSALVRAITRHQSRREHSVAIS